jgi:hypothetical protein
MRGTGWSRRVGIVGKPHGGQGVEESFESGLYLKLMTWSGGGVRCGKEDS